MATVTAQRIASLCNRMMPLGLVRHPIFPRDPLRFPPRRAELMRMAAPHYYSAEMVRALPDDGQRYETVHGELLVTPSPRLWHQEIVFRLAMHLTEYSREVGIGHAFISPADISWGPDTLVQPDVFVTTLAEARSMDWKNVQTLLLAVEVLSPSSTRADRFAKRRLYQEVGVPLYWVVGGDAKLVEVWTAESVFPAVEQAALTWHPEGAAEPFRLELEALFRPL